MLLVGGVGGGIEDVDVVFPVVEQRSGMGRWGGGVWVRGDGSPRVFSCLEQKSGSLGSAPSSSGSF